MSRPLQILKKKCQGQPITVVVTAAAAAAVIVVVDDVVMALSQHRPRKHEVRSNKSQIMLGTCR